VFRKVDRGDVRVRTRRSHRVADPDTGWPAVTDIQTVRFDATLLTAAEMWAAAELRMQSADRDEQP